MAPWVFSNSDLKSLRYFALCDSIGLNDFVAFCKIVLGYDLGFDGSRVGTVVVMVLV